MTVLLLKLGSMLVLIAAVAMPVEQDAPETRETAAPFARIPREAISRTSSFIVAYDGESYFYNYDAGIVKAPFLHNVYKPFGLSHDSRYFLYLKSNGHYPTFSLFCYDLVTGEDRKISDESVHHAAWSPAAREFAYISLDRAGAFHLSIYDLDARAAAEVAIGRLQPDFLEWSPNGDELLYISIVPLTRTYVHDQKYSFKLHQYSTRRKTETAVPDVTWARFDGSRPLALSKKALTELRQLPNPAQEEIRDFVVNGGQVYATVFEAGEAVVKRLEARSGSSETVAKGQLYTATERGVVVREFARSGVTYRYLSTAGTAQAPQASPFSSDWKMPLQGSAYLVQGGASFGAGTCDGAQCIITAHRNALGYALDWQQVTEQGQGSQHVLAVEDGTVVAVENGVSCNSNSSNAGSCPDYANPCNDPSGGLGNYVSIAHPDGSYSFYGHMKFGSIQVVPNQTVTQGTYLGDQGHSGVAGTYNGYRGCGDHLHFQRQTSSAPWAQSIATNFAELPCLLTCTSSYLSANVENSWAPAAALTVTLSPGTILGAGASAGNRVILDSPAPAGGAVVTLASSNPSLASVPPSVTVAAGATSAAFALSANSVPAQTNVTISASYGGVTATAVLTIAPVSLARMNLWQFSVTGGGTVGGNELDITSAAPSEFPISLSSSAPAVASVPSTATVPAGSNVTYFAISTAPVASTVNVTITATDGTVTKSQVLQVKSAPVSNPPALTAISPSSGSAGSSVPVTLTGSNFAAGATVGVSGSGVTTGAVTVVSPTQITVTFAIAANAVAGARNVTVTTSAGTSNASTFTVNPPSPPSLSAIAPSSGTVGTTVPVTLSGANFLAGSTVAVSAPQITVSNVNVVSATQITATFTIAAATTPGSYGVTVTTAGGTSGPVTFTASAPPPPNLNAISPASGATGASVPVTLTGTNFLAGSTVASGTPSIAVSNVTVVNSTQITATFTIAPAAVPGGYGVTVSTSAGTSGPVTFTVNTPSAPTLAAIAPPGGAVGTSVPVTLTGTSFLSGSTVATTSPDITVNNVSVVSTTQITATFTIAPAAALGTYNVSVTTSAGTSNPAPFTINAFSPIRVNAGGPAYTDPLGQLWSADNGFIVSSGTANFTGVVLGASAPALYPASRYSSAGAPPLTYQTAVPNGTYAVNLKFLDAVLTGPGARQFDIVINGQTMVSRFDIVGRSGNAWQAYDLPLSVNVTNGQINIQFVPVVGNPKVAAIEILPGTVPAPAITSISPASVAQGATVPVTITGMNFLSNVVVNAGPGTTLTNITVVSPTQITATLAVASNAATGTRNVTVTTPGGITNAVPLGIGSGPVLNSISPNSGMAGTAVNVTLTGSNFASGATVSTASPGIAVSNVVTVSATQITATFSIAANAAPGAFNVTVTAPAGTSGAVPFTINAGPPALASISPASGQAGSAMPVTLTGTNFVAGATVGVSGSGVTVSGVFVVSATQITATFNIAAGAAPGVRNVSVTTSGGTTGTVSFTVNAAAPSLTSISPASGSPGATVPVTLTGTNFIAGATVNTGSPDIAVSNVVVASATQITANFAVAANAAPGSVAVSVTTSGGTSGTVGFTILTPPPTLVSVSPAAGVAGAAVPVTLTGTNFVAGASVMVSGSGVTVSGVTVVSANQIAATFNIAAGAAPGVRNVSVTTSGGTTGTVSFTVNSAPPTLASVSPAGGVPGSSVPVTLSGTGFLAGAAVSPGTPGIVVSNVAVVSATQITATFTIALAAVPGGYGVTVTTSGGTSGTVTFTVAPPPAPGLSAIAPPGGAVGTSVPVTLTGTSFLSGSTVATSSPDITVSNVNVVGATQITAMFTIAPAAALGTYNVSVTTAAGTSNPAPFTVNAFSPIRVNAGGPAYTDPLGQLWSADNGFIVSSGTANFTGVVLGASAPALYPASRYSSAGAAPLTYQTAVPNGTYTVNLKFLDAVITGPGGRQFDIVINGQTMVSRFDIVGRSGNAWQAYDLPLSVNVTNGQINIQFVPVVGNPKVAAIEILPGTVPAPAVTSISPASVARGATVPLTITGTNFPSNVVVNAGPGTTLTNVKVVSPTQITATLSVASNTSTGTRNVTVTTTGGMTSPVSLSVGP